jgi:undecaprenyl-diphosphatase
MSAWIHDLAGHAAWLDAAVGAIAVYGVAAVAPVLAAVWLIRADGLRACLAAVAGAAFGLAASAAIGLLWDRPRPFVAQHFTPLISHAADASFPSDHLAVLGAVVMALWFTARRLALVTAIVALAVAFARVYVGVHYVSDVAGGFVLGLMCGALAWGLAGVLAAPLGRLDHLLVRTHLRPQQLTPIGSGADDPTG